MDDRWAAAAALVDGSRRALFDYVRRQHQPVSREEAADALDMSRGLAAFHLDKLVDAGLLRAHYRGSPDRPRARGRAPKLYEPAQDGVSVTVPERRYQLIAEILADAVAEDPADAAGAAQRRARERGHDLGVRLRTGATADLPGDTGGRDGRDVNLLPVLAWLGFEPWPGTDGRLLLHNCPFHALATRQTALVCGLNHAFLSGLVAGLAAPGVQPDLAPRPGACCVALTRSADGPP